MFRHACVEIYALPKKARRKSLMPDVPTKHKASRQSGKSLKSFGTFVRIQHNPPAAAMIANIIMGFTVRPTMERSGAKNAKYRLRSQMHRMIYSVITA